MTVLIWVGLGLATGLAVGALALYGIATRFWIPNAAPYPEDEVDLSAFLDRLDLELAQLLAAEGA